VTRRAVILSGGKGTRLRPYTVVLPKPLMPIGEYPILEVITRQLIQYGFDHITLAVNHQAEILQAFFGDGSKWGIKIDYSLETKPLNTMGPLTIIPDLPEKFLVMNGDILTDLNFREFHDNHLIDTPFTICAHHRMQKIDYGVLKTDESGILNGFEEKPQIPYQVSMGIYMVSRDVVNELKPNEPFGFDHLMLKLIQEKRKVQVHTYEGYWLDIGRPDDYEIAIDEFERNRELFLKE
jgi:NDP-sugar pyrophosphorylase family protein